MNKLILKALVIALGLFALTQDAFSTSLPSTAACEYETYTEQHICTYDSFYFNQQWIHSEGDYQASFMDANGCDSIVHLKLWHMPNSLSELQVQLCEGEQLNLNGFIIKTAGTYQIHYQASWGCDSTVILHVQMQATTRSTASRVVCEGDSLFFGNAWLTASGIYEAKFARPNACDSIVTMNLQVIQTKIPISKQDDGLYAGIEVDALQWLICPTYAPIPNATQPKLTLVGYGYYSLRVENNGCIDTLDCIPFKVNTTDIGESIAKTLTLYPNPVRDVLHIDGDFSQELKIQVFTLLGQEVLTEVRQPELGMTLDLSMLTTGRYIVRILEKGAAAQNKIIEIR